MDAQTFLDNFATIAEASGAVERLRGLVLDLAVSGRLVKQNAADEPASSLLTRIAADMNRSYDDGHTKPNRAHTRREPSGALPVGWCWAYVPQLGFVNPRNQVTGDPTCGFVPMPFVPTDTRESVRYEERRWSEISKGYTHVADGDVVVAKITPCFQNGKSAVIAGLPSGIGAATTELYVVRPTKGGVNPKYLHLVFRSPSYIRGGLPEMTGTAGQQRVPRQYLTDTALPIPPRGEQERIVAKVGELMGLCDELEARQEHRHHATKRFRASALHAFTEVGTNDDLLNAWRRLDDNWQSVANEPDGVSDLRQAVLQLAIKGRLVAQDTSAEPAQRLVYQLAERRGSLGTPLPPEERPGLPDGWAWVSFGQATINRDADRVPLKRADRAVRPGQYDYYGASGVIDRIDDYIYDGDFLLIGEDGANLVLRSTPIAFIASGRFWVNNHAHVLESVETDALRYLAIFINSIDLRPYLTGIAQPKLNQARLNRIPVPLPPLAEQRRIVERVDQLLAMCNELGRAMRLRQSRQLDLAHAACLSMAAQPTS